MAEIVWHFEHPRIAVWEATLNADRWPLRADGFSPVEGAMFTSGPFPALGSEYLGRLDCSVSTLRPHELCVFDVSVPRYAGSPSQWEIRTEWSDHAGGTQAITKIHGARPDSHSDRLLTDMLSSVIRWMYGHVDDELNEPTAAPSEAADQRSHHNKIPPPD